MILNCSQLKELELASCKIKDEILNLISEKCSSLQCIRLDSCTEVSDIGVLQIVSKLNLKEFYLRQCKITDDSVVGIANNCSNLRAIRLDGCARVTYRSITQ